MQKMQYDLCHTAFFGHFITFFGTKVKFSFHFLAKMLNYISAGFIITKAAVHAITKYTAMRAIIKILFEPPFLFAVFINSSLLLVTAAISIAVFLHFLK